MPAQLVLVDPRSLVVDANVRSEVLLDRAFVGSVKGSRCAGADQRPPFRGWLTEGGAGTAADAAAVEAGRELVPVFVIDAPDEEKAAEVARIVE